MQPVKTCVVFGILCLASACSGDRSGSSVSENNALQLALGVGITPVEDFSHLNDVPVDAPDSAPQVPVVDLDQSLKGLLRLQPIQGDATRGLDLPSIDDPLSQLGMKLFYSKSLGGDMDSACVSCHHPTLGGADNLSLGVGVHALNPDVIGPGRVHVSGEATVPRNAPTTFNSALYQKSLFWDSRVMALDSGIRSPESLWNQPAPNAGDSLLHAQAKFPVTSAEEMRTDHFEPDGSNNTIRQHLAARIGGYDGGFAAQNELASNEWLTEFQTAFAVTQSAEQLVTYDNIAKALASYEASQIFVDNPWNRYVSGDTNAIGDQAKRGAILFFSDKEDGGAHCSSCHSGDLFSDESHHVTAFPQIGPGKGDGQTGDDDFGLARETGNVQDRYRFRTPSLLNIEMTAPYGHAGSYKTLREVVNHYAQPDSALSFFDTEGWCHQITSDRSSSCNSLFPSARVNTRNALVQTGNEVGGETIEGIALDNRQIDQITAFLHTLTDPCTKDRNCLAPWIATPGPGPDGNQLNGVDRAGNRL